MAYLAGRVGLPFKDKLHAEVACLLASRGKAVHTLLITRYNSKGEYRNAKPCPICQEAISLYKVERVLYSTDQGIVEFNGELL